MARETQRNMPVPMSTDELLGVLESICRGVRSGDTAEGSIEFLQPYDGDPPGADFMVMASYRQGNLHGQGMVRLIGKPADARPVLPAELHGVDDGL